MMRSAITLIAYYLPQYYEIDFNNQNFCKGYTEWTNTANAKPLFKGHYQPHVPADLGFYNLLMPEARKAQADMAKKYGVDGFCYWHYWFGNGKTIMEKPLNAVLDCGEPNFPFCLCWANHSWKNLKTDQITLPQLYPGFLDEKKHFEYLLPAFRDKRYIRINGKLLFSIFAPQLIPDINMFMHHWNDLANEYQLGSFYFVGMVQNVEDYECVKGTNIDAINSVRLKDFINYRSSLKDRFKYIYSSIPKYSYKEAAKYFIQKEDISDRMIPTIISGWDHSPRTGKNSLILTDYTPDSFERHIREVFNVVSQKQNKLCFIKAWNEWGEGNHLEPDLKWGLQFLERLKLVKDEYNYAKNGE